MHIADLAGWLVALGSIAVLAALVLPMPFSADSAMFVWGARELHEGVRIYADFWDMKQPGIFWFCQIAGSLFGFDAIGIHLGEALWQLALAVVLVLIARQFVENRLLAYVAPLFCLAPYYAAHFLTMVEMLVVLPIAVIVLCVLRGDEQNPRQWLLHAVAGAMLVVVAVFKLFLVLVPGAVILAILALQAGTGAERIGVIFNRRILPMLAGAVIATAIVSAWLYSQDALGIALWTAFVYPVQAIEVFPARPLSQLLRGVEWLVKLTWPLLLLAPAALLAAGRTKRTALLVALLAWIVVGAIAVSAQALSRWTYHMQLFLVPIGLLGLLGLDVLFTYLPRFKLPAARVAAGLALGVFAAVTVILLPLKNGLLYTIVSNEPWTAGSLREYQERLEPRLAQLRESAAFLNEPDALPGKIVLLGDSRILLTTSRRPVVQVNGWAYHLPGQLEQIASFLEAERPPYVYVSWYVSHYQRTGTTRVFDVLESQYERIKDDAADGSWFRIKR